jgi:membrane associated rhomboid family serine protease
MNSVGYLMHAGGCLQGCVLSVLFEAAWWLTASYMKQVGSCLQECVRTLSDN